MRLFLSKYNFVCNAFQVNQARLILFAALLISCLSCFAQASKHVLLVSIDGLRPEFYKSDKWHAPNLKKLKAEGVYADKNYSVFPSVTYPSHTSIITGALPARHGVYYNAPFEAESGRWYWEENFIKVPTLWDAVKNAGLTSGSVMWPVTVGAPIDYNIPVKRPDGDENMDQLSVTKPYITPQEMLPDMVNALGGLTARDFKYNRVDITIGKAASYIIKKYKPNLMAVHFINLDHMQHEAGMYGAGVQASLTVIDSMLNVLITSLKEAGIYNSTTIIITGDHGFADVSKSFSPNVILANAGLISQQGWTAKFQSTGGSSFLYLKNRTDQTTLKKIRDLLNALPEEQRRTFRIIERSELDKLGANPEVVMALAMQDGTSSANNIEGQQFVVKKKVNGSHGQYPYMVGLETGFIATGSGIKKGGRVPVMHLINIAPLISKILNLKFKVPDGTYVSGILN